MSLLSVKHLEVRFAMRRQELVALRDVSFDLDKGERLGIVGESGAGKSVAALMRATSGATSAASAAAAPVMPVIDT